jgi:hypothetical protein
MQKGVKERQIRTFAELDFIPKAENIVFIGETGVGKTGLMVSLARKAVQNGYRALFIKAQDLLDEMYASLADRSTRRLLKSLANVDVLAIDELGYVNIKPEQTNIFFKLMEERHHRKPTLITTNLAVCHLARLPRQSGAHQGAPESSARALPHHHHRRSLHPPSDRLIESIVRPITLDPALAHLSALNPGLNRETRWVYFSRATPDWF